jgi:chromosome segregation ATPase
VSLGWKILIGLLLMGAAALTAHRSGFQSGADGVQSKWDAEKLKQAEQHAVDLESARLAERAHAKQLEDARNEAAKRETTIRRDANNARTAAGGLRNDLDELKRQLPSLAAEACHQRADTLANLLGRCESQYRGVAERADRHANDVQTLSDGWPK